MDTALENILNHSEPSDCAWFRMTQNGHATLSTMNCPGRKQRGADQAQKWNAPEPDESGWETWVPFANLRARLHRAAQKSKQEVQNGERQGS